MKMWVRSLASLRGLRIRHCVSCGVSHRRSWDAVLLHLWHRLAATAPIQPLAWEPLYAEGYALKRQKQTNQQKTNQQTNKKPTNQPNKQNVCYLVWMVLYETFTFWTQSTSGLIFSPSIKWKVLGIFRVSKNHVSFSSPPPSWEAIVHR